MSGAFVKEPDGDAVFEDLPERPVSTETNLVTPEGLVLIETELARLQREHANAQAANDRAALARISRDLRYWTARKCISVRLSPSAATMGGGKHSESSARMRPIRHAARFLMRRRLRARCSAKLSAT
jgi:hypothetical protein